MPTVRSGDPEWLDAYNSSDKVRCDCPWPRVQRSGSQSLGIVMDIDLCCLAEAVEQLARGETPTKTEFVHRTYTKPAFDWDDNAQVPTGDEDYDTGERDGDDQPIIGTRKTYAARGAPAPFHADRLKARGLRS